MNKVYCIVCTEGYVYIPIKAEKKPYKAEKKPYKEEDAYLKQLPNFFGGTIDKITYARERRIIQRRNEEDALHDEVYEESKRIFNVGKEEIGGQMSGGLLLNATVKGDIYKFYLISISSDPTDKFSSSGVVDLTKIGLLGEKPEEREMSHILQVPIGEIIEGVRAEAEVRSKIMSNMFDSVFVDKLASKILSACSKIYTQGHDTTDSYFTNLLSGDSSLKKEWDSSETKKAFAKLAAFLFESRT